MQALTHTQLRSVAPSVFTRSPYHKMSDRYKVAATADVVDLLSDIGLFPVRAQQSKCRLPDKREFSKHMIRFRKSEHMEAAYAAEVPEVVLVNSFDGSSAYKLTLGIYRVCCTNGLVCPVGDLGGFSVRHAGGDDFQQKIIDASYQVIAEAPGVMNRIAEWKNLPVTAPQQLAFAEAALTLREHRHITAAQLLAPKRVEDAPAPDGTSDLWRLLNTTQEHLMKGGDRGIAPTGRRMTTRAIKSVDADLKTNRALWMLSEKMAELLA